MATHKRIFISYSSRDKPFVDQLSADLRRNSLTVWEFSKGIVPGDSIPDKISNQLKDADHYLIILSPNAVSSHWVNSELETAIQIQNSLNRQNFIIPVLYENCQIPTLISGKRHANFTGTYESGFLELLGALKPTTKRLKLTTSERGECEKIVALGGGNMEHLYMLGEEIFMGQKNKVADALERLGGGGMNFASRLLNMGHQVFPVLAVGNDHSGQVIRGNLADLALKTKQPKCLQDFIRSDGFYIPNVHTATATIMVQRARRTILSYASSGDSTSLRKHFELRLREIENILGESPTLIRISHLQDYDGKESASVLIKAVINSYHEKSMIYLNPGISQICKGITYWQESLVHCDLVQLNLNEAKQLFTIDKLPTSLVSMMNWFMTRQITVLITMAKFGAVGSFGNGKSGIVLSLPIEISDDDIKDPTGAGDAFSAGMVSELPGCVQFTFQDFHRAMDAARFWAAYACKDYGGAFNCPDAQALTAFRNELESISYPLKIDDLRSFEGYLKLIDKAYA